MNCVNAPQTKDIKESFLYCAFELNQAQEEVKELMSLMNSTISFLTHKIGRRKYIAEKEYLNGNSFSGTIMQCHQLLRHNIKTSLGVYKEIACQLELDKLKVDEEIRKIVFMRMGERHQFQNLKYRVKLAKSETKKIEAKFEELVKQKYIYRLDEHYMHEGEAQRTDEELDIIQEFSAAVGSQIKAVKEEEKRLKEELEIFWRTKPESVALLCNNLLNLSSSIIAIKSYQSRLKKLKAGKKFDPAGEKMADLGYQGQDGDIFNSKNVANCGVDMEYTGLGNDGDLPDQDPCYQEHEDIAELDKKLLERQNSQSSEGFI